MAPKSVTNMVFNLSGLLGFILCLIYLRFFQSNLDHLYAGLLLMLATLVPMLIGEWYIAKCYKNPSTGLDFSLKRRRNTKRIVIKLFALFAILLGISGFYHLLPEYRGSFYDPYYTLLKYLVPVLITLSIPYFYILDRYLTDPEDSYWKLGMFLLGQKRFTKDCGQLLLAWFVKVFFLPLMFIYFIKDVDFLMSFQFKDLLSSFRNFYDFSFNMLFSLDVIFAAFGYMCTLRILDSHVRSTEPTLFGWAVALMCYQPFWSFVSKNYIDYDSGDKAWGYWFADHPTLYIIWGSCILILLAVYYWATLSFGFRFSNLTHRGIITNGPYRFTKHPAYISKNLAWWFISMPFMISSDFATTVRHTLMLCILNTVYFLRAKTEERHLLQDPVYQDYCEYIREKGLFALLGKSQSNPTVQTLRAEM